jgi:LacI family transcriptional regulator
VALLSRNDLDFPTLAVDHHGGAFRLAQALAGLGYRRFAVLHGDDRIRMSHDRGRGFLDGLRRAGIVPGYHRVIATDLNRDGGHRATAALLGGGAGDLEAVFAVNDVMAIGAMTAIREAGLRPGRDVAVAGFDDIDAAGDVTPTLTSVRVPLRDLGRRAVELALAGDPGVVEVPVEVVLRDSTPPR